MLAMSTRCEHLQAAMEVHQALSGLHGNLGGVVYLDLDQQRLWFVVCLGHLQRPRHGLRASPWISVKRCFRKWLVSATSPICKRLAMSLRKHIFGLFLCYMQDSQDTWAKLSLGWIQRVLSEEAGLPPQWAKGMPIE